MGIRLRHLILAFAVVSFGSTPALAGGKWGFADSKGGSQNDPVIEISASIGPNQGAVFSLTEEEANGLYRFQNGTFQLTTLPPIVPPTADGANQWLLIDFPMKINKGKTRKSLIKDKASLAATSFLTANITITDETGAHIPGIAAINGRAADKNVKLKKDPFFPVWLDSNGKNQLVSKSALTYVADDGDMDLSTIAAFGPTPGDEETTQISEIRIRLNEVEDVTINGFWVLKMGDGAGNPASPGTLTLTAVTALSPLKPEKFKDGKQKVESFSKYVVQLSEPVVPLSMGFSAAAVEDFNSDNPLIPLVYNGNTSVIPNPDPLNLGVPIYPTFLMNGSPNSVASFTIPFNIRPINSNNMSQFVVAPLIDLPGKLDVTLLPLTVTTNVNPITSGTIATAATTLYNVQYDDNAEIGTTFRTKGGRAFTNVAVAPNALYYASLSGTGGGMVNLDGQGYETNDEDTSRVLLLTNALQLCACTTSAFCPGPFLLGCNPNTFGDGGQLTMNTINTACGAPVVDPVPPTSPIGLANNPPGHLGGPTPVPGVNVGSTGSTATNNNPLSVFPLGFETPGRNSDGDPRLAKTPLVGRFNDMVVGDFLDTLFYDTLNPNAQVALHTSLAVGGALLQNSISDPPVPNPPPLRLPVGLQPIDIVFDQQDLLKPAFVIEGDEVFTGFIDCAVPFTRIQLIPNSVTPLAGDNFPTFGPAGGNGPFYQTFGIGGPAYAARQQVGNFLFVADQDQGVVQILNSNNFSVIGKLNTPDPEGLSVSPDLATLYVTNFGDDTVSIIGADPFSPFFGDEINRINVGAGPRSVKVQPDNEDVFIVNFLGNSCSILDPESQTIRTTITNAINRPWDVALTPRLSFTSWLPGIYLGYIANQGSGEILIYESGPSGTTGIGLDDVRWSAQLAEPLTNIRGLVSDPGTYPGSAAALPSGVYVCHSDPQTNLPMVSRIVFSAQLPSAGAFPPVPPPSSVLNAPGIIQRTFEVVGSWGGPLVPLQQQLNVNGQDPQPYDVALSDISAKDFFSPVPAAFQTNLGAFAATPTAASGGVNSKNPYRVNQGAIIPTFVPDRMYVSFPGDNIIQVLDPQSTGTVLNTIHGLPVPGSLTSYFDI